MLVFRLPDPGDQQLGIGILDAQKRGDLPLKGLGIRVLSEEPKFVQKRRKQSISEDVSTFENENR